MEIEDLQAIGFMLLLLSILVLLILIAEIMPMNISSLIINSGQSLNIETLIIMSGIVCFILAIGMVFLSLSD